MRSMTELPNTILLQKRSEPDAENMDRAEYSNAEISSTHWLPSENVTAISKYTYNFDQKSSPSQNHKDSLLYISHNAYDLEEEKIT